MAQVAPYGQPQYGHPGYGAPHGYPPHGGYGGGGGYPVTQQPQPVVNNVTVVTNQPAKQESTSWQIGLCDCFNSCGTCALVYFCTPIAECIAANKLGENCCYPFFFQPCGIVAVSVRFRTLHRIEQGMCEEACLWQCCRLCMLCRYIFLKKFFTFNNILHLCSPRLLNEMRVRGQSG